MNEKKATRRRPRWPIAREALPASGQGADGGTPRQQDEAASARTTVQPAAAGLRTASSAHDPLVGSARVAGTSRLIPAGFRRPPSDAAGRVAMGADRRLPAGTTEEPGPVSFRRPPIAAAGQLGDLNRSVSRLVRYPNLVQVPVDDDQQRLHPD